jgi:CRISPR-associated endonuclease Csn1
MLQELNNLRIKDGLGFRPLTLKERNDMYSRLRSETGVVSFSTLAKAAGFKNATVFNLERDEKRRGLAGDRVGAAFADPNVLGAQWDALDPKCQHGLAVLVEQAGQVEPLILALQALPDNLEPARGIVGKQHDVEEVLAGLAQLPSCMNEASRRAIASLRLPDDFGSLSLKALARIVPEMEREVVTYDVAVQRAGYSHHSQMYTGEIRRMLPYYGEILTGYTAPAPTSKDPNEREYGRIPNPTVHIGLNQLRQLINALSKRYGTPREIIIELTREFGLSGQKRRDIQKMQAENQDRNDAFNNELIRLGVTPNRDNRLKLQLWYELGRSDALDRYCVYSGHRLSMTSLFSDEIEVDHVLPFSRSLHDGVGNKVLCTRQSNRDKGNRTPFEAFGTRESWPEIVDRAARLPGRKPALFQENALEEFLGESDFLARHLTDTAYFGRAARQYLCTVCHPDRVWVSSGRLTGLLRAKWGLSRLLSEDGGKNREDHRHHALDAAVVGICSRSIIQRMAAAASRAESRGEQRLLEDLDLPWDGYRHDLADSLQKVIVSHKPEHGREGALHNDTNYGRRGAARPDGMTVVAHRKPLETIANSRDAARIVDPVLRNLVTRAIDSAGSPKEVKAALSRLTGSLGIRRAMVEEPLTVISINDRRTGEPYRFVKGDSNYCREIFLTESGRWDSLLVSTFEANSAGFSMSGRTAQNGRPLVMRIRKGDMLLIETNGDAKVMLVQKFTPDGLALAEHFEGNADARARSKQKTGFDFIRKSPEPLRALKARLVGVDVLGYVNDPGFG